MSASDQAPSAEPGVTRNLPVPVRQVAASREFAESWLTRVLRNLFGWRGTTIRADLTDVLEDGSDQTDFSPTERRMLKNILALRERRVGDAVNLEADLLGKYVEKFFTSSARTGKRNRP